MGTQASGNSQGHAGRPWRTLGVGVADGLAFWATNFATSLIPIAAAYREELAISYTRMVLVESLVGGLIIGCCVVYAMGRLSRVSLPATPILRSVTLSLVALALIQAFATVLDLGYPPSYILLGAALNVPRFLALGVVIGLLWDRSGPAVPRESKTGARPSGS